MNSHMMLVIAAPTEISSCLLITAVLKENSICLIATTALTENNILSACHCYAYRGLHPAASTDTTISRGPKLGQSAILAHRKLRMHTPTSPALEQGPSAPYQLIVGSIGCSFKVGGMGGSDPKNLRAHASTSVGRCEALSVNNK